MWRGGVPFIIMFALFLGTSAKAEPVTEDRTLLELGDLALGLESSKRLDDSGRNELGPPKLSLGWQNDQGLRIGAFGVTKNGVGLIIGFKYQF